MTSLAAVTPRIAVIPVGFWRAGYPNARITTFVYSHPRADVVTLLEQRITRDRTPSKSGIVRVQRRWHANAEYECLHALHVYEPDRE